MALTTIHREEVFRGAYLHAQGEMSPLAARFLKTAEGFLGLVKLKLDDEAVARQIKETFQSLWKDQEAVSPELKLFLESLLSGAKKSGVDSRRSMYV